MAKLHAMHLYYLREKEALRKLEESRVAVEFCGTEKAIKTLNNLSKYYQRRLEISHMWADPNYRPEPASRPTSGYRATHPDMLLVDGEWITKDSYYHKSHY